MTDEAKGIAELHAVAENIVGSIFGADERVWPDGLCNAIDRALSKVATAARQDALREAGWRDISTAPRDGTPVLVSRDMGEPWGWVRGWSRWVDVRGIAGWISQGFFEIPGNLGLGHPTHWQPLPPPPSQAPVK